MRNAFSLLEMVIVVMILGVLAAIAIPRLTSGSVNDKAYMDVAMQFDHNLDSGVSMYLMNYKRPPTNFMSWVALGSGTGGTNYVRLGPLRRNLANPDGDIMVDGQTLRLVFKNGLTAEYRIDGSGNVSSTYSKP
jgi:prepilin-type N-terminal cleavage/methylation domain-containing protein